MIFLHAIYLVCLSIFLCSDLEFYFICTLLSLVFIIVKLVCIWLLLSGSNLWIFFFRPESIISLITVIECLDQRILFMRIAANLLVYISILDILLILLGRLIDCWVFIMSYFFFTINVWRFCSIAAFDFVKIYPSFR